VFIGEKWLERRSFGDALSDVINRQEMVQELTAILSRRELQVTRMVASGMRNREIGKKLFIAEGTVKVHLHNIYEKLEMDNRLALTLFARKKGLLDDAEQEDGGEMKTPIPARARAEQRMESKL